VVIFAVLAGCSGGGVAGNVGDPRLAATQYPAPVATGTALGAPRGAMPASAADAVAADAGQPSAADYQTAQALASRAMERQACMNMMRGQMRQMQATGQAVSYAGVAAGAAGPGGRYARKAIGVANGGMMKAQVQQMSGQRC
jgi:hypothetical protein